MPRTDTLYEYLLAHSTQEDEVLAKLRRDTFAKCLYPQMISGEVVGTLLTMMSRIIQAKVILEIGSFTGYSAICLARGLAPEGKLYTIELNPELEAFALPYYHAAKLSDTIIPLFGNACDLIPDIPEKSFDLVFIDADKENYSNYYELVIDRIRSGGLIIADNVLWGGKVLEKEIPCDKESQGIAHFNTMIAADSRVSKVLIPLRDGITLIRKN